MTCKVLKVINGENGYISITIVNNILEKQHWNIHGTYLDSWYSL